jgi:hypothetical protein
MISINSRQQLIFNTTKQMYLTVNISCGLNDRISGKLYSSNLTILFVRCVFIRFFGDLIFLLRRTSNVFISQDKLLY